MGIGISGVVMIKIKICDVRTLEIVEYCRDLGVDFIGIHQIKAPISKDKEELLQNIKQYAGNAKIVLVTQEKNLELLAELCLSFPWDYVQLHFNITVDFVQELKRRIYKHYRNIGIIAVFEIMDWDLNQINAVSSEVDYLLFDKSYRGGTGEAVHNEYLKKVESSHFQKDYFIAGGLTPENVREKINLSSPFAVDVQTGVEYKDKERRHQKDPEKIKMFVDVVRGSR